MPLFLSKAGPTQQKISAPAHKNIVCTLPLKTKNETSPNLSDTNNKMVTAGPIHKSQKISVPAHKKITHTLPLKNKNKTSPNLSIPKPTSLLDRINRRFKSLNSPLRTSTETPGRGDCWWEAISDQAKIINIESMKNLSPNEIRKMVISNIKNCPTYQTWLNLVFKTHYKTTPLQKKQQKRQTTQNIPCQH
jgi:hypothetical protein